MEINESVTAATPVTRVVQLAGCTGGSCPKVFVTADGEDVIVQGAMVGAEVVPLADDEGVVRIPRSVFDAAVEALRSR